MLPFPKAAAFNVQPNRRAAVSDGAQIASGAALGAAVLGLPTVLAGIVRRRTAGGVVGVRLGVYSGVVPDAREPIFVRGPFGGANNNEPEAAKLSVVEVG